VMNLGLRDGLIDREHYRFPRTHNATLADLSTPVADDAAWDAPGTLPVTLPGMTIRLPEPSHAVRLELSLTANRSYLLEFRQGYKSISKFNSPAFGGGTMRTRSIVVPAPAPSQGFDHILVRPVGEDDASSIGYLRLYDR
jgi:hypothetical protein